MYLVFDTETNGLPKIWGQKLSRNNLDNWPRVTQLAFMVLDAEFNVVSEYCQLIHPDGWTIPDEKFFKDNNMSTERCQVEGIPIMNSLSSFVNAVNRCEYLVAHNIAFDYPVLGAELLRAGVRANKRLQQICTMKSTTEFMNLPRKKWPKLEEIHIRLFGENFDGAHDALADVRATAACLKELKIKNLIREWKV